MMFVEHATSVTHQPLGLTGTMAQFNIDNLIRSTMSEKCGHTEDDCMDETWLIFAPHQF